MPNDEQTTENFDELLIEGIFCRKFPSFIPLKIPIQFRKFYFGIRIVNQASSDFLGGQISGLKIDQIQAGGHTTFPEISSNIPKLKPGQQIKLWLTRKATRIMAHGHLSFHFNIKSTSGNRIRTYQVTSLGREDYSGTDSFQDSAYIFSQSENQQRITNYLLLFLGLVTVVIAILNFITLFRN